MFATQGQAKRFFVDKIVAQAAADGVRLSDAERWMLSFSESDPEFVVGQPLEEEFRAEISEEDYEAKIGGLLKRSWTRDVKSNSKAGDVYREAFMVLSRGDHYLLIMIERALGRHVRPWWAIWRWGL